MTSLAASISYDSRGQCGLYFIADSRISWGDSKKHWDHACKTFSAKNSPDIFAYVGSAFLPVTLIPQVIQLLDMGCFPESLTSPENKHKKIIETISSSLKAMTYKENYGFKIIHGTRLHIGMQSEFMLWITAFKGDGTVHSDKLEIIYKDYSYFTTVLGSGENNVKISQQSETFNNIKGTSRRAIHLFCEELNSGTDALSGGPPQMVGLYRIGNGRNFGFIWNKKKYISGMETFSMQDWNSIDWRNSAFEICDGETGNRKPKAKIHNLPIF